MDAYLEWVENNIKDVIAEWQPAWVMTMIVREYSYFDGGCLSSNHYYLDKKGDGRDLIFYAEAEALRIIEALNLTEKPTVIGKRWVKQDNK